MRSLLAAMIMMFVLAGCAGPVVVTRPATDGMIGVPYCLPRTVLAIDVEVKVEGTGDEIRPSATLSVNTQTVADTSCSYVLQHNTNDSSDDDLKIAVGSNGLLASLDSESTQQGRAIADAALRTLVAAAKLAATEGAFALFSTGEKLPATAAVRSRIAAALRRVAGKRTVYIPVPDSLTSPVASVNPFPEDKTWKLTVSLTPVASPGSGVAGRTTPKIRGCLESAIKGIVVRGLEPFVVEGQLSWDWEVAGTEGWNDDTSDEASWLRERGLIFRKGDKDHAGSWGFHGPLMSAQGLTNLPDYAPVTVVPVDRAMFVKTKHKVTFTNGTLANVDINRPSPIAAIATFPAEVAEALVNLPAQLVQVRISNIKSAEDLAAKKTEGEKAAQKTENENVVQRAADMNTYIDAKAIADVALRQWQDARGTPDENKLAADAAKAMNTANSRAQIVGKPAPFPREEFPNQYR